MLTIVNACTIAVISRIFAHARLLQLQRPLTVTLLETRPNLTVIPSNADHHHVLAQPTPSPIARALAPHLTKRSNLSKLLAIDKQIRTQVRDCSLISCVCCCRAPTISHAATRDAAASPFPRASSIRCHPCCLNVVEIIVKSVLTACYRFDLSATRATECRGFTILDDPEHFRIDRRAVLSVGKCYTREFSDLLHDTPRRAYRKNFSGSFHRRELQRTSSPTTDDSDPHRFLRRCGRFERRTPR
jgi:hypothetical protein